MEGGKQEMNAPPRRGFSLIEMIAVISVSAVLTGIAISLLLVLLRAEHRGRSHLAESDSLQRLADQFRRDAHAATDVTVNATDPTRWQFNSPGTQVVRYMPHSEGIWREEEMLSENRRMEPYVLPKNSTATVEVDRKAKTPVVTMTINVKDALPGPGHEFRVVALLGRDLRFTKSPKEEK
jgi:prepilin-type N-terminal cleavage/methylation domain-containing protein